MRIQKVHSVASEWQREVWLVIGDTLESIWWAVAEGEEGQNPGRQWRKRLIPVFLGHVALMDDFRGLVESSVIGGTEHLRLKRQFAAVQKLWVYFTPDGKVW